MKSNNSDEVPIIINIIVICFKKIIPFIMFFLHYAKKQHNLFIWTFFFWKRVQIKNCNREKIVDIWWIAHNKLTRKPIWRQNNCDTFFHDREKLFDSSVWEDLLWEVHKCGMCWDASKHKHICEQNTSLDIHCYCSLYKVLLKSLVKCVQKFENLWDITKEFIIIVIITSSDFCLVSWRLPRCLLIHLVTFQKTLC